MPRHRVYRMDKLSLKRRDLLGSLGSTLLISLVGCFRQSSVSVSTDGAAESSANSALASIGVDGQPACTVRPQQTEGPYFVDERLNRADIRADPATGTVKPGVPLKIQLRVSQVGDEVCMPLAGAIVDIWHCDAEGIYSDAVDRSFSTLGQQFLRGSQVTDADGRVEFVTIYPGWYPGRTVHIHFKIRGTTAGSGYEFTSQLYFDDAVTDRVNARDPYNSRGDRTTRNQNDGIFRRGGEQLMLPVIQAGEGYDGSFEIGLELA